jgi:hypothetical protein
MPCVLRLADERMLTESGRRRYRHTLPSECIWSPTRNYLLPDKMKRKGIYPELPHVTTWWRGGKSLFVQDLCI